MIRLYGPDNTEIMAVRKLERDGDALAIKGKIYGTMPLTAKLYPEDVRAFFKVLTPGLLWYLVTMPFRRSSGPAAKQRPGT
jgi:hypothetical protein